MGSQAEMEQLNMSICLKQIGDQDAVAVLEKTPFREDSLPELFSDSTLRLEMRNDIYSTYRLQVPPHLNGTAIKG